MRFFSTLAIALALSACVSREVVYQRNLTAPHPGMSRSEFEQIAKLLSKYTRRSITRIEPVKGIDEVFVHTAFPGEEGEGETVALVKDHGQWRFLDSHRDIIIE